MARYLALTGGVGGAKLALGLAHVLDPDELLIAVNTGDDFEHLGLTICPDLDTLTYTLAGENNTELGWGRQGESWNFLEALEALGGESWFQLGDRDMALHVVRSQMLRNGATLTEATQAIAQSFGITHRYVPMSDEPVRTTVHTADGPLSFQHYFVRDRCQPEVTGFDFVGADQARLIPQIEAWLAQCDGVIVCPSNPFVSVDPILAVPGMRAHLERLPTVAVSPIVAGLAIKGPTAKMMAELGVPSTAAAVARHYAGWLDRFVIDASDAELDGTLSVPTVVAPTVMVTLADRIELARTVVRAFD